MCSTKSNSGSSWPFIAALRWSFRRSVVWPEASASQNCGNLQIHKTNKAYGNGSGGGHLIVETCPALSHR